MKASSRLLSVLALITALGTPPAHAALQARSQVIDPATGYPTWYQDTNGLALTNCLDQNGFCLAIIPGGVLPANRTLISPANFPDESFYFQAFTSGTSPGGTINLVGYRADLEAGFGGAAGPIDGQQAVFSRIRIRADVTLTGTYTVTHPYGVETFVVDAVGPGNEINFTNDQPGLVAGQFDVPVTANPADPPAGVGPVVGPTFLTSVAGFVTDPVTGNRYIGNPAVQVTVTGSPFNTNFVSITAPNGDNLLVSTFGLQGKVIGMDVAPSPTAQFDPAVVGNTTSIKRFTVTNLSGAVMNLSGPTALAVAGANAAEFTVAPLGANNTCANALGIPATPAGSNTCFFDVTFNPAASTVAARTADLTVTPADIANAPPVTVKMNGTARFQLNLTTGANGTVTNGDGSPASTVIDAGATQVYRVTPSAGFLPLVRVNGVRQAVTGGTITLPTVGATQTTAALFLRAGDVDQSGGNPAIADAMRALRIAVGVSPAPTDEEITTADVGPLVSGAPRQSGKIDISDVMVILRRAVGLQPLW